MKQHKDMGRVWAHRPDALPLPDAPSTGARRKKGPLEKMPKKHLWDLARQMLKELKLDVAYVSCKGIPTRHLSGSGWFSADCDFGIWACERLGKASTRMDEVLRELERRME